MALDDILQQVRYHVNDYKVQISNVVDETPARGKNSPFASTDYWNTTATGKNYEEFLTKSMPLVSGLDTKLKGGRWLYTNSGNYRWPDPYSPYSGRVFQIDYNRGVFVVPSGATPVPSGEKILLSYSFLESREYRFSDDELKSWISVGDSYIRNKVNLPYSIYGRESDLSLNPVPSGLYADLLALSASYFIRKRLQEEGIQEGISVRDGETAFSTTQTLSHRTRGLEELKKDLDSIILDIKMGDLSGAGARIFTYGTRDYSSFGIYTDDNTLGDFNS
jgi:hypothetical protein